MTSSRRSDPATPPCDWSTSLPLSRCTPETSSRRRPKAATKAANEAGRRHPGVHVIPGKEVVELSVSAADKGSTLADLALASRSNATLYVGDDATDERAFAALQPLSGDLTIKVGPGETVALHRVPGPEAVVELLRLFVDVRRLQG